MLEFLRRGTKSWTAKILFLLLIVSFAVWGIGDVFTGRQATTVAEVGEVAVEAEDFARLLARQQAALSREAGQVVGYDTLRAAGFDRRVLASLVRDAALSAELDRLGITAPDTAVAAEITRTQAFQTAGAFDDATYRRLLSQQGFSVPEFEGLTRTMLGQRLLTAAVAGGARPQPGAAARIAAREGETRTLDLIRLTPDLAPDPGAPDDAALAAFHAENPGLFTLPERRDVTVLHVDIAALIAQAIPDEAAARARYDANLADYTDPPTRTLDQISFADLAAAQAAADRLAAGATDFDALAAELGQAGGISLGAVQRGDLPPAVAEAVFAATAPGIVGPVATPLGAVLIRVTAVHEGFVTPFEIVGPVIRESMARDVARDRAPEIATRIEELRAEGRPLADIAAETGQPLVRYEGLARDASLAAGGAAEGVALVPEAMDEIFAALEGEERDILALSDGGFAVVEVAAIRAAVLEPLEAVRDRVAEAWRAQARLRALEALADGIVAELAAPGGEMAAVAARLGRPVTRTEPFGLLDPPEDLPPPLIAPVFAAPPGGAARAAAVATATEPAGVLVAEVAAITPQAADALAAASRELDAQLTRSLAEDQAEYFARAVEARLGLRIYPEAIDAVFQRLGVNTGGTGG